MLLGSGVTMDMLVLHVCCHKPVVLHQHVSLPALCELSSPPSSRILNLSSRLSTNVSTSLMTS